MYVHMALVSVSVVSLLFMLHLFIVCVCVMAFNGACLCERLNILLAVGRFLRIK